MGKQWNGWAHMASAGWRIVTEMGRACGAGSAQRKDRFLFFNTFQC
jgi:hypothetical protein